MHIVLSGIVDLSCTYKGHEYTALIMSAGDISMPAAALFQEPFLISARALTATRLLTVDADAFRSEARRSPELALSIARIIAGQWRLALKIILDLKCRSPSQRLASFLLRLYDAAVPGTVAEVPFSKRQLASRVGMQPETLSRLCRRSRPTAFTSGDARSCSRTATQSRRSAGPILTLRRTKAIWESTPSRTARLTDDKNCNAVQRHSEREPHNGVHEQQE